MAVQIITTSSGLDEKYLKRCDQEECQKVLKMCSTTRSAINLSHNDGYTRDKFMRMTEMIPKTIFFSPHFKHVFHNPDPIEKERLTRKFLELYPKFKVVDKR